MYIGLEWIFKMLMKTCATDRHMKNQLYPFVLRPFLSLQVRFYSIAPSFISSEMASSKRLTLLR